MAIDAGAQIKAQSGVNAPGRAKISALTLRTGKYWAASYGYAALIGFFTVYTAVRIFMNADYFVTAFNYLTPMYSPCVTGNCVEGSADFGTWLPTVPFGIPMTILIIPILAGFRGTCYYYRKIGWRGLWASPNACAVPEPHKKYTGEAKFPLNIMNLHRFFWMLAFLLLLINTFDTVKSFIGKDGNFRIGLGTVIILVNVLLLWGYTMSCHAGRHILAGRINNFSKHPVRYQIWTFISRINPSHGTFAMASLVSVISTDFYIAVLSHLEAAGTVLPGWL